MELSSKLVESIAMPMQPCKMAKTMWKFTSQVSQLQRTARDMISWPCINNHNIVRHRLILKAGLHRRAQETTRTPAESNFLRLARETKRTCERLPRQLDHSAHGTVITTRSRMAVPRHLPHSPQRTGNRILDLRRSCTRQNPGKTGNTSSKGSKGSGSGGKDITHSTYQGTSSKMISHSISNGI